MLSRKQVRNVQVARGLSVDDIIIRSGIPPQSFMALMSEVTDGRDPNKLISDTTFRRLAKVLSLDPSMSGLCTDAVNEWRYTPKTANEWMAAVTQLRKELFGDMSDIEATIVTKKAGLLARKEHMIYLLDMSTGIRLVISNADKNATRFIVSTFNIDKPRVIVIDPKEFEFNGKLIENGVYRIAQFNIVLGGKAVKYSWPDVQAAAKEFNFTTDDLINLMVDTVSKRDAAPKTTQSESAVGAAVSAMASEGEQRPFLRVAASQPVINAG